MLKVILPSSFNFDSNVMRIVDVHSRGVDKEWLRKSAAVLTKELKDIRPEPGVTFAQLLALGDQEYYGLNRNGDGFPEKECKACHNTFVKHAHWFHNHKNKLSRGDPSFGFVKHSAHNPEMHRTELIVGIYDKKDPDSIEKLANGEDIPVSMACITDPDYPVLTKRGYAPISKVRVGDEVWTHEGRWREVTQLNRRRYTGELVTAKMNGLPLPLEMTADHPMYAKIFAGSRELAAVKTKAGRYFRDAESFESTPAEWAHAEHLGVGDRLFYQPVTGIPGVCSIDSPDLARMLGFYTAEGSLTDTGVEFTCNMDDELLKVLPELVEKTFPGITCSIRPKANSSVAFSVVVNGAQFSRFVEKFAGRRCKEKFVPLELFNSGQAEKLSYVGAWLDGDGFIDKKGAHISSANLHLVLSGRDLLASIGIPSSIYKIDHTSCATSGYEGSGVEYTLNISTIDATRLREWSAKVASMPMAKGVRGKPSCMRACPDGRRAYRIKDVTRRIVTDVMTYNFEVEEDHSYSLAGLISHNCNVPFDECTECHNKARSRSQYCECLKKYATQMTKAGNQIGMINHSPDFFDISKVHRNADRIAFTLRKVASAESAPMLGADMAQLLGITPPEWLVKDSSYHRKLGLIRKLAAMEKEIEGTIEANPSMQNIADALNEPCSSVPEVPEDKLGQVFTALADARVSLPLEDFLKLVTGGRFDDVKDLVPEAKAALPGVFADGANCPDELLSGADNYEPLDLPAPNVINTMIRKMAGPVMDPTSVNGHVTMLTIRKKAGLVVPYKKQRTITKAGQVLAREYARYKVAFLDKVDDNFVTRLSVLQNYG